MMHLELTNEEHAVLLEILDTELEELRSEIRDTDRLVYREMLKARERIIRRLLAEMHKQEVDIQPA